MQVISKFDMNNNQNLLGKKKYKSFTLSSHLNNIDNLQFAYTSLEKLKVTQNGLNKHSMKTLE